MQGRSQCRLAILYDVNNNEGARYPRPHVTLTRRLGPVSLWFRRAILYSTVQYNDSRQCFSCRYRYRYVQERKSAIDATVDASVCRCNAVGIDASVDVAWMQKWTQLCTFGNQLCKSMLLSVDASMQCNAMVKLNCAKFDGETTIGTVQRVMLYVDALVNVA